MIYRNRRNLQMSHLKFFAHSKRNIFHDVAVTVFQLRKPWIHVVIKDVSFQQIDYFLRGVDTNWFLELGKEIIDKDRKTGNVIHVRVGNDDVPNCAALLVG